ncbi:hypothetical protein XA68_16536 [Ophiocordyceps unilateralis]|uniref:Uncharacterized protein n=1 Tax=Ophiocordyceps unilateralis TaxID=268505 RepID=A0A2A9P4J8_OPHUN|nr:hypothetical protein XA68_16536 [Ophiocordyceps unilateralis]
MKFPLVPLLLASCGGSALATGPMLVCGKGSTPGSVSSSAAAPSPASSSAVVAACSPRASAAAPSQPVSSPQQKMAPAKTGAAACLRSAGAQNAIGSYTLPCPPLANQGENHANHRILMTRANDDGMGPSSPHHSNETPSGYPIIPAIFSPGQASAGSSS